MKPLIKKYGMLWFCEGHGTSAGGLTPRQAYEYWLAGC